MNEKGTMTAVEYLQEKARMTTGSNGGSCTIQCGKCPLGSDNNGRNINCGSFEAAFPEEAETIVREWAEAHPVKTMRMDFFEKFPNAPTIDGRTPFVCPKHIYRGIECVTNDHHVMCGECWERPLEV